MDLELTGLIATGCKQKLERVAKYLRFVLSKKAASALARDPSIILYYTYSNYEYKFNRKTVNMFFFICTSKDKDGEFLFHFR